MRAAEADQLGRLAGRALAGTTGRVGEVHRAVAGRVFTGLRRGGLGPVTAPTRWLHAGISGLTYTAVRGSLEVAARLGGLAAAALAAEDGSLADHPDARGLLAFLNGAWGDLLAAELPALALPMRLRAHGRDVAATPDGLAGAYPDARGRVAVFLHGLVESDDAWGYKSVQHYGEPGVTFGSRLGRDRDTTAVFLRYNSGLRISANGAELSGLLDRLVAGWPVPVRELVLIGHSMGGLVARSALAQADAAGHDWPTRVSTTVMLGSPQLGAPLERGTHALAAALAGLEETRPFATMLSRRSVGIKDLRHGSLLAEDWTGHDPDAWPARLPGRRALPTGPRHLAVLATLSRRGEGRFTDVIGDLLVPPRSALGDTGDDERLDYPVDQVLRLGGLHHFDLLNHPAVYAHLLRWLPDTDEATPR